MSNIRKSMYPQRSMLASCLDSPPASPPSGIHFPTSRLYPSVEQFRPDPIVCSICLIKRSTKFINLLYQGSLSSSGIAFSTASTWIWWTHHYFQLTNRNFKQPALSNIFCSTSCIYYIFFTRSLFNSFHFADSVSACA